MIVSFIVGLLCVLPVRLDNYGILLIPLTVPEALNRISVQNKVKNEILRDQQNLKPIKTNQELFRDNKIPLKSIKSKHNELLSDLNSKSNRERHEEFWNDRSHVKSKKLVDERFRNYEVPRLDIENYDEPTETTDIDTVDYNRYKASEERSDRWNGFGDDKIVGGLEVESMNLYPYHVSYGTNCGGAIIGKKWVLTAGHCGKKPYVRVGSKYINQGRKVGVKKSFIHPQWSASNKDHPFDYDFQILELNENLKMDDNVQPVKIAHIEDMVIGKVITVTGWGNTEENGPYSSVLRAVRVPIISKENCQHVPFPYFRGALTARMFCAGFSEGKKDACQGDSGGPAVAYDRLLGMVSFGYGCATPGSYGVYSKVAKVRPWIQEVTGLTLD